MNKKELIEYFRNLGIEVHTSTKARGHHGFYLKNRIDVSKNVPENKKVQTLIHEFAHYIHSKIEPGMEKSGGSTEVIFKMPKEEIEEELLNVTCFVDRNVLCEKLKSHKAIIKSKINEQEKIIKKDYPYFMRSKNFKEFEKYIKRSDARYLLKYDRVQIVKGFWSLKHKIYSIKDIERDFSDMPRAFCAYLRLHSYQKKQARISARINKIRKYYTRPTELFARFVEGIYLDKDYVTKLAPKTTQNFYNLLNGGYYMELKNIIN